MNPIGFAYAALKSPKNENAYASLRGANSDYQYFADGSLRGAYASKSILVPSNPPKMTSGWKKEAGAYAELTRSLRRVFPSTAKCSNRSINPQNPIGNPFFRKSSKTTPSGPRGSVRGRPPRHWFCLRGYFLAEKLTQKLTRSLRGNLPAIGFAYATPVKF